MRSLALKTVILLFGASVAFAGTWGEHESKLAVLRQRVKDTEGEIRTLLEERKKTSDTTEVKTLTERIGESYKGLEDTARKLDAEEEHVRYKHPEHAEKADVKYVRRNLKSMQELESEVGIDGRLDHLKAQVLATYPISDKEKASHMEPKVNPIFRKPASVEDPDAPDKIELTK